MFFMQTADELAKKIVKEAALFSYSVFYFNLDSLQPSVC